MSKNQSNSEDKAPITFATDVAKEVVSSNGDAATISAQASKPVSQGIDVGNGTFKVLS